MKTAYNFEDPDMSTGMRHAFLGGIPENLYSEFVPAKCLEVGVYDGRNACWLLDNVLSHEQSTYTGIDYIGDHQLAHNRAIANLKRHAPKTELVIGNSLQVLPQFVEQKRVFDLIFIDGCHSYDGFMSDVIHSWKLLEPGGFMVCDDYLRPDYGIAEALYTFLGGMAVKTDYQITYIDYGVCIYKSYSNESANHE